MNRRRFLSLLGGGAAGSLIGIPAAASAPAYGQIVIDGPITSIKLAAGAVVAKKIAICAVTPDDLARGSIIPQKRGSSGTPC